ncbi:ionotropic receptor 21a-like [Penaeus japonicus]|uniref:ionotropic receptor 21a-like n=1 Tax=Penaeus japonicus TaxID=27405 RepID=UPI001C70CB7B|nr:ionotropic receptor 21a-like [Penaeus japonicus]
MWLGTLQVVEAIGSTLNFKPVFEHPGPARWGTILPNGTHTGMVGRISNDEAEMGVGNVFVTEVRAQYITFSIPYDYERACFLTPSPKEMPRWMALTFPFTLYVWLLLIMTVASLVVFVPLFGKVMMLEECADDLHTFSGTFLYITALFCNQATILPSRTPMQVMAAFLIISGFLTTVFYSSNLKAFMMVKVVEQPYTSIRQIVESDYDVGGFSDFWRAIFSESSNENVQKLGQKFFSFFPDITPHLSRVASRQVVLLENTQHLTYLQESYLTNRIGESPVRLMLEECINPFGIGALLRRNSPLKAYVDMAILRMREAGLVDKYFEEVLLNGHDKGHSLHDIEYDSEEAATDQGVIALTLEHLQGAFLVLGFGLFAALLVMLAEVATALCKRRNPLKPKM